MPPAPPRYHPFDVNSFLWHFGCSHYDLMDEKAKKPFMAGWQLMKVDPECIQSFTDTTHVGGSFAFFCVNFWERHLIFLFWVVLFLSVHCYCQRGLFQATSSQSVVLMLQLVRLALTQEVPVSLQWSCLNPVVLALISHTGACLECSCPPCKQCVISHTKGGDEKSWQMWERKQNNCNGTYTLISICSVVKDGVNL